MSHAIKSGNTLTVTAPYTVSAGAGVLVTGLFGIAMNDATLADTDLVIERVGVFDVAKDGSSGPIFAAGDPVYWDDSLRLATTDSASTTYIGLAVEAAGTDDATVRTVLAPSGWDGVRSSGLLYGEATFDATGGKAATTHALTGDTLPDNAHIVWAAYEVETTFTDGVADAATIALGVTTNDASGLVAAVAIADAGDHWDAGLHDTLCDWTAANATTKTTAARALLATVGGVALTAGKLSVKFAYVVGAA